MNALVFLKDIYLDNVMFIQLPAIDMNGGRRKSRITASKIHKPYGNALGKIELNC